MIASVIGSGHLFGRVRPELETALAQLTDTACRPRAGAAIRGPADDGR
jgi:hypothetical protein